ncbi:hypothetical protein KIPB_007655 [Kipferlia bialata]|uniref:Protein kinase domain-containing protein n=1 Tax=Kipferlia bialata TaxID=797122 RepID=A0A9K3CZ38_9EUKA|nr:hypothetical protein KIPB_007655 [Kipferlia bialata]|eukprot:g7655.t1
MLVSGPPSIKLLRKGQQNQVEEMFRVENGHFLPQHKGSLLEPGTFAPSLPPHPVPRVNAAKKLHDLLEGNVDKGYKRADVSCMAEFLSLCLQIDPSKRASVKALLKHSFITGRFNK